MKNLLLLTIGLIANLLAWGQTQWEKQLINENEHVRFDDISFIDGKTGVAISDVGIYLTQNQGKSWSLQHQLTSQTQFRSIELVSKMVGFAGTITGELFKTLDGGLTWIEITHLLSQKVRAICGIHSPDGNTIYFTGAYSGDPYFAKSMDGGESWEITSMNKYLNNPKFGSLVDIYFKDKDHGFVSGRIFENEEEKGVILSTNNGGLDWEVIYTTTDDNCISKQCRIWKLQFIDDQFGFASIEDFSKNMNILKTVDGGKTWENIHIDAEDSQALPIQGVGFLNENIGWVGGWNEGIFETQDGGKTWEYQSVGGWYNRFERIDENVMMASGRGVYRHTSNTASIANKKYKQPINNLVNIYPNPTNEKVTVKINLEGKSFVQLSLHDQNMRTIDNFVRTDLKKGTYEFTEDISVFPTGIYYIVLYTRNGYETKKITIH